MDVVDSVTRSRMMAGIQGKNTKPELLVRSYLHSCGYRFRLHRRDLPGRPDLVLPKYRLAIFVHGCFWHRHSGCMYAVTPKSRRSFWEEKLAGNVRRDEVQLSRLNDMGWRVLVVWECGLKHSFNTIFCLQDMIAALDMLQQSWPSVPPRPLVVDHM